MEKKKDLFWRKTFPLLSTSVGQVFTGQAKLGPESLDILAQFSLGLQKTTGFMLNLNWITVFILFLMLPAPIFFFFLRVNDRKQFCFRSMCKKEVWFGIQVIRIVKSSQVAQW